VCGDGVVNQASEECDRVNDAACPGACRINCTCRTASLVGTIEADVSVRQEEPNRNFGADVALSVDADIPKHTFLRVRVNGIGTRPLIGALLHMRVFSDSSADSNSGGRIHAITACGWSELTMTWNTQPAIDGVVLDEVGPVAQGDLVVFDITNGISGDGTYCFALDSLSSDSVKYNSREAAAGGPVLELIAAVPPVCGDGEIDQPIEECDGSDDVVCPGSCQADCTCPPPTTTTTSTITTSTTTSSTTTTSTTSTTSPSTTTTTLLPPVCGDGSVNQPSEECDGNDDAACPGSCQADCTCLGGPGTTSTTTSSTTTTSTTSTTSPSTTTTTLPPPVCGDGTVNQPSEQCDGVDDAACPGACRADCTCAILSVAGVIEADVTVQEEMPTQNFGASPELLVDASAAKQTFLRVRVDGVGGRRVLGAHLRMQVASTKNAESVSGGRIHAISDCGWDELSMTWNTRPAIDGVVLDEAGAVGRGEVVVFDVTGAMTGGGTFCFALDSLSSDGVTYGAKEAAAGGPEVEIIIDVSGVACGDGTVNQLTEECDGFDALRCPGACQLDCTCSPPVCGDHRVNQPGEECDGPDDTACRSLCQGNCTCDALRPVGIIEADVGVRQESRDENFGAESSMSVDLNTPKRAFLRARVRGVGTQQVLGAWLHLHVVDGSDSDSGGRVHTISACGWDELTMTWNTKPAIDGAMLDELGPVQGNEAVEFDVTDAIAGDGTYCFALDSLSSSSAKYGSREALVGRPWMEIVVAGVCGDNQVNETAEECDGFDDAACPGDCLADCTCAVCGDNLAEAPAETCDGTDDAQCPGECDTDCACPFSTPPPFACLGQSGPHIALTGTFLNTYANGSLEPGTKIDARRATFLGWPGTGHLINLDGGSGVCVAGGTVLGQYDRTWTWDQMHSFNSAAIAFNNAQSIVDGMRIDNVVDGIRPRDYGTSFTVRNAWLSYVRDDCVENDHLQGGLVEDSLFDGCFVAFSARPSPAIIAQGFNGSGNVLTVQRSLIRLEAMPDPPEGNVDGLGHGGFFKWHLWDRPADSLSPKLALYDNVFMAERVGHVGDDRMGIPPDQLLDCANNVMVWLGPGEFPETLPACFTVTTDRTVWDNAVADWLARHPQIGR